VPARFLDIYGHASIQGLGSFERYSLGVPFGGAFDAITAAKLNGLLGNLEDSKVLELAMVSCTLEFDDPAEIAWGGTNYLLSCNQKSIPAGHVVVLRGGDQVQIKSNDCMRIWIAVKGGFDGPALTKRILANEQINYGSSATTRSATATSFEVPKTKVLRFIPSANYQWEICDFNWTVSMLSDRVGVRFNELRFPHNIDLPSAPSCPGAIQVTPGGEIIISGPDGPTTGGYPIIGAVVSADFSLFAQAYPEGVFRFDAISLEAANSIKFELERGFRVRT